MPRPDRKAPGSSICDNEMKEVNDAVLPKKKIVIMNTLFRHSKRRPYTWIDSITIK